jgi:hypothetical protein
MEPSRMPPPTSQPRMVTWFAALDVSMSFRSLVTVVPPTRQFWMMLTVTPERRVMQPDTSRFWTMSVVGGDVVVAVDDGEAGCGSVDAEAGVGGVGSGDVVDEVVGTGCRWW